MIQLIFATNNAHKIEEVKAVLGASFTLETLKEAGIDIDIPEPYDTLQANALGKARTIYEMTGRDCFAEDTGLEVPALGGEPGVRSARYAGESRSDAANIQKVLEGLYGKEDRSARFRTVIALIMGGREYCFEGVCPGTILEKKAGDGGFGYDPVFVPLGMDKSFAEMLRADKNKVSHRRKALDQLIDFLKRLSNGQG